MRRPLQWFLYQKYCSERHRSPFLPVFALSVSFVNVNIYFNIVNLNGYEVWLFFRNKLFWPFLDRRSATNVFKDTCVDYLLMLDRWRRLHHFRYHPDIRRYLPISCDNLCFWAKYFKSPFLNNRKPLQLFFCQMFNRIQTI